MKNICCYTSKKILITNCNIVTRMKMLCREGRKFVKPCAFDYTLLSYYPSYLTTLAHGEHRPLPCRGRQFSSQAASESQKCYLATKKTKMMCCYCIGNATYTHYQPLFGRHGGDCSGTYYAYPMTLQLR